MNSIQSEFNSHLTKAAKASPSQVYKLITAISTAAPNKPKCCIKKEPSEERSVRLDLNSNRSLPYLNQGNKTGKDVKLFRQFLPDNPSLMSTACKMEGTINFHFPLWSVCSEAKVQEEIWDPLNFSQSKSKAGRASSAWNVQDFQYHAQKWEWETNVNPLIQNNQECKWMIRPFKITRAWL